MKAMLAALSLGMFAGCADGGKPPMADVTNLPTADIRRLKDSLERWDELMIHPAPAELKPVYMILRGRVQERLAELEAEAAAN